jgi:ribosomal protein S19
MFPTRALLGGRSVWKGPHIVPYVSFLVLCAHADLPSLPIKRAAPGEKAPPPIRTQARSATILPNFVGLKFQVHNGQVYHDVTITEDMVGHKLGEFSP